jgi:hypothetical protein
MRDHVDRTAACGSGCNIHADIVLLTLTRKRYIKNDYHGMT